MRKLISVLVCLVYFSVSSVSAYSQNQNLAGESFFNSFKLKTIPAGMRPIIEATQKPVVFAIQRGVNDPKELKKIDRRKIKELMSGDGYVKRWIHLLRYPINYKKALLIYKTMSESDERKSFRNSRRLMGAMLVGVLVLAVACTFDRSGLPTWDNPPWDADIVNLPDSGITDAGIADGDLPDSWFGDYSFSDGTIGQYTVTAQSGQVTPDYIASNVTSYNSTGMTSTITAGDTVKILYNLSLGGTSAYAGMQMDPYTVENVALKSTGNIAMASSSYSSGGFMPENAMDGIKGISNAGEWASNGEKTAWWQVNFSKARDINTVRLYDRPNTLDWITSAKITFSDGTSIFIGSGTSYPIDDTGTATILTFPEKKGITYIKVEILSSASTTQNIGLSEFEALSNIWHSDMSALSTLKFNARGTNPFGLVLEDSKGQMAGIKIDGLDTTNFKGVTINLVTAISKTNPLFDLKNVKYVRIIVPKSFTSGSGWVEIKGLYKSIPSTTLGARGEYAVSDPDMPLSLYQKLVSNLSKAVIKETQDVRQSVPIYSISEWEYLSEDGMDFIVEGNRISAFTLYDEKGKPIAIYKTAIDEIREKLDFIDPEYIDEIKDLLIVYDTYRINHEKDEAKGLSHKEAVLNEFIDSINGLNRADIIKILLRLIIRDKVKNFDAVFHKKFISELLINGMFFTRDIYRGIIHQLINKDLEVDNIYDEVIGGVRGLVTNYLHGKKVVHYPSASVELDKEKLQEEPGFNKLFALLQDNNFKNKLQTENKEKTIYFDLSQLLIKNDSLSDAVTIDCEYMKRLVKVIKLVQKNEMLKKYIRFKGLVDNRQDEGLIVQLVGILRDYVSEEEFAVLYNVDFNDHFGLITKEQSNDIVSILSQENVSKLKDVSYLKIITPVLLKHNMVNSVGNELYAALLGLSMGRWDFVRMIYEISERILNDLVLQEQISVEQMNSILREILTKGIGFIPAYFNPMLYYKSIEFQRALLTSA
jgi:hypothetical protein